jgi:hypothetical protein
MGAKVKSGNPTRAWTLNPARITRRRRDAVGRPVVIGLGTLILILIVVAWLF